MKRFFLNGIGKHVVGILWFAALAFSSAFIPSAHGQLSKANQIFLNRGVELQGMVEWDDFFNLATYQNLNYTSVNWLDTSNPSLLGPPPGFAWSRWVSSPSDMPPLAEQGPTGETPYLSQLISLELADELNLNDGPTRTNEINWFNSAQTNVTFANTILYINNYGGQVSDSALGDIISKAHPDLICFDQYPFTSQYDTNYPNDIGAANSWPFTSWFSQLWRYRQFGINYGIPFGTYMQTFNSVESYDSIVYRNPSPSELRFNNFAALAFNAKMLTGFTYNNGATALFNILPNGYSGDTYTNALYGEQADVNHRAQILGRSLVCLKPVPDLHNPTDTNPPAGPVSAYTSFPDGITTGIMIMQGRSISGGVTNISPAPISFQTSPASSTNAGNPTAIAYTWWEAGKNDPYLNGWGVTNLGTNNNGLSGQVIVAWFNLLDESLDGPLYTNEIYMMVVNALTTTNGSAADCLQEIKLNFLTGTNITNVNMLDLETGAITTNLMPVIAGSGKTTKRQLVLDLNGGDAALFKFSDGAPFVGHITSGAARLTATMQNGFPSIQFQGTALARYQLQSSALPSGGNWTALGGLFLTNSSGTFVDKAPSVAARYYRVVGIP